MSVNWKSAATSGVYALLLIMCFTPLSILAISLLPVPILMLYVQLSKRSFAIHLLAAVVLIWILIGAASLVAVVTVMMMLPAMAMGHLYRKQASARAVVTAGSGLFLAGMLIALLFVTLAGFNLNDYLLQSIDETMQYVPATMLESLPDNFKEEAAETFMQALPLMLILYSLYMAIVLHVVGSRVLRKMGFVVPRMLPMREWMMPKSIVWYFLIAYVLQLFVDRSSNSTMSIILLNLIPLLELLLSIQAMCFIFFVAYTKKWPKFIPIVCMPIMLIPVFCLLGMCDIVFSLRKNIQKPK